MAIEVETRKVHFRSGGLTLEGLLSTPSQGPGHGVVLCHPHTLHGGNMKNYVIAKTGASLAEAGFTALRFNFRGAGKSEGAYDEGRAEVGDVVAAIDYMAGELGVANVHLCGYSFGSAMMIRASAIDARPLSFSAIAPPVAFMDVGDFKAGDNRPKLVVTGGRDEYSTPAAFGQWFGRVPEPKTSRDIPGADHFFGGFDHEVAAAVCGFVKNTVGLK